MAAKKINTNNEVTPFTCCWCHEKALEIKVFNGMYYHVGECIQAAIIRHRLTEAEEEFDTAPDETVE